MDQPHTDRLHCLHCLHCLRCLRCLHCLQPSLTSRLMGKQTWSAKLIATHGTRARSTFSCTSNTPPLLWKLRALSILPLVPTTAGRRSRQGSLIALWMYGLKTIRVVVHAAMQCVLRVFRGPPPPFETAERPLAWLADCREQTSPETAPEPKLAQSGCVAGSRQAEKVGRVVEKIAGRRKCYVAKKTPRK